MYANAAFGAQQYASVGVRAGIEDASPHRLIQMLFEGGLQRLATAKGAMQREDRAVKGEQIGKAIGIIGGLRESLNPDGGELSENLESLYAYMQRRLLEANIESSIEKLEEVSTLLRDIKEAWDGIAPEQVRQKAESNDTRQSA
ncbi:flagella export chaperone FliS [Guyparkeria sp. SCN-R1]|uniref:flagellar export chaperone FliS n=1 Tax=Guyparkeria sp. SCN-R1 TaxID=2341113 RepID=UPI000F649D45|nr:flagellar export chaperone FliS [Guyparkeria sp. SCN-R1]RRQ24203.1 flagella export chaperone FliS [Guyparkeria sp. SCN-R1]